MIMSRFWEFGIGGLVGIALQNTISSPIRYITSSKTYSTIAGIIGLLAITFSALYLDKTMEFPGIYALLPTIGTALIIIAGGATSNNNHNITSKLLATKPLMFLGRISYSIYLIHWVIIVYYRLVIGPPI